MHLPNPVFWVVIGGWIHALRSVWLLYFRDALNAYNLVVKVDIVFAFGRIFTSVSFPFFLFSLSLAY